MNTIIDLGETGVMAPAALATSATVTTTLYDLIATIQDIVGPGNDRLVVATVVHMLSAGSRIVPRALDMQSSTALSSVADC
jgi:energy-coupling factor transporter transmembrane protein EcfT